MATLAGQRAQFTWALNQYNKTEDENERLTYAKRMAKYIKAAPIFGYSVDDVTQGQSYPANEVRKFIDDVDLNLQSDISEEQAINGINESVDAKTAIRMGQGSGSVYAYGYRCAPDRLKIGCTNADTLERIAAQIGTSTPDQPVLFLEIKTDRSRVLERALHAIFELRGKKILGGGTEWFRVAVDEIVDTYHSVNGPTTS